MRWICIWEFPTCIYFFFYKLWSIKYSTGKTNCCYFTIPRTIIIQLPLGIGLLLLLLLLFSDDLDDSFFLTILLVMNLSILPIRKWAHLTSLVYLKNKICVSIAPITRHLHLFAIVLVSQRPLQTKAVLTNLLISWNTVTMYW